MKRKMILLVFIGLSLILFFYVMSFQKTIFQYRTTKKNYTEKLAALNEKKSLTLSATQVEKLLAQLKRKYPDVYNAAQSHQTPDQLLQMVTFTAEKSGFSVVHAELKKSISHKIDQHWIELKISGHYQNLFYFINQLNKLAWPFTLLELTIPQVNQFDLQLSTDGTVYRDSPCIEKVNITPPTHDPFSSLSIIANDETQNIPLQSLWIPLYFASADTVTSFISNKSSHILSPLGKINFDKRSNQIWLKDDAKHIKQIRALIKHLDQPDSQFLIRAKIINIDRGYQKKLGVLFRTDNLSKNTTTTINTNEMNTAENAGEFTVTIAKLAENDLLNLQISALEQEGHASLISSPALTTLNNQPAVIESGEEVPYQEATSSGATNVSFKKAVMRLKVTPQRLPNNHILLHIALNQDKVSALTVNGVPAIQTQQITTQVIVKNYQTIVLGGILETSRAKQNQGVPVIDKLPLVGELFQNHQKVTKQQELLIFITPSMMQSLSLS